MLDGYFHLDASAPDPLADLEDRLAEATAKRALVVETWAGKEKSLMEKLAAREDGAADERPLAFCFRGQDEAALGAVLSLPVVRALRMKTVDLESMPSGLDRLLEHSGRYLLCHGELGIGQLTRAVGEIATRRPRLRIYIPHLGWPRRDKVDDADWPAGIAALSALPNVIIGVSGLASFSRTVFPHDDVRPLAQAAIGAFGPDRLVAATDYPYIDQERYSDYYHLSRQWITGHWPQWSDRNALRPY
jgi:predicted TIM-barrel fold metal-dependent hydrolase